MARREFVTKSPQETQKVAAIVAVEVVSKKRTRAFVVAFEGELGAGKTTFAQGFARVLGIKENVLSPTFVLIKIYKLPTTNYKLKHLVHIDCYRIDSPRDLLHLGFRELLKDKDAIILIEWADKIKKLLPARIIRVHFHHISSNRRKIVFAS